jgi:GMP synthase-like glutamine amidotransferase
MAERRPVILAIQNDETDAPHLVGRWLEELGFEIRVLLAYAGEAVPTIVPDGVDALIPLGGHMNANEDHLHPWLPLERALLKDAIDRDIPIFAICLGTQLLAVAGGGRVDRAEIGEVGIYSVTGVGVDDSIFAFDKALPVAQWHEDQVSVLPDGATLLASSELCVNQIYRLGSNSYGVQFHPEIDLEIVKWWEAEADNAFKDSGKKSIQAEMAAAESALASTWKPVIERWGKEVLAGLNEK